MHYLLLVGCIVLCETAGVIGSVVTIRAVKTWYKTLRKPPFNPPPKIFGSVWTMLYLLMGIALFIVSTSYADKLLAYVLFGIQLVLNTLWSFLFFGAKRLLLSFVEILVLLGFILATTVQFWAIQPSAALLLIPYAVWVSFATVLSGTIWWMNRKH